VAPPIAIAFAAGASGEGTLEGLSHVKLIPKSPAGVSEDGGHWAGTDLDGHVEGHETVASSKVAVHHPCRKHEHCRRRTEKNKGRRRRHTTLRQEQQSLRDVADD
jgi:hypothetical protein